MRDSFYRYLMTQRKPTDADEVEQFANNAFLDSSFPKQSTDFDEISKYLEENAEYLPSMTIFDTAWQRYLDAMNYGGTQYGSDSMVPWAHGQGPAADS